MGGQGGAQQGTGARGEQYLDGPSGAIHLPLGNCLSTRPQNRINFGMEATLLPGKEGEGLGERQRCFGHANQFLIVTKLCRRKGAATWAE